MLTNVDKKLVEEIQRLKRDKNAVILAHYYQRSEIQDIADYLGDSLYLSQMAKKTDKDLIVFCGVFFMAETAKILSPNKKVIIPDKDAGCSLADSCKREDLENFIKRYPDHLIISYINCSAEVKAISDIICTSGNVLKIVQSLPKEQKIIFAPDKNLGAYVNGVTGRDMILWDGSCEVHDIVTVEKVMELKVRYPNAKVIAHPECKAPILTVADYIGSTAGMLEYTRKDSNNEYIVATESGIIHQMKKHNPDKNFHAVASDSSCLCNECRFMKLITLDKVLYGLQHEKFEIQLDRKLIEDARAPVLRMLDLS